MLCCVPASVGCSAPRPAQARLATTVQRGSAHARTHPPTPQPYNVSYHTCQREREDADRKKREFFKEMEREIDELELQLSVEGGMELNEDDAEDNEKKPASVPSPT